jgi:hypothetical protein
MADLDWKDNLLALRSNTQSNLDSCFSDAKGNKIDYSFVSKDNIYARLDKLNINNNLDEMEDIRAWLINKKKHPPEHYLAEEANLNPFCLRQRR